MNTYTICALTEIDAMQVKRATDHLTAYDQREGITQETSLDGTWDLKQAAKLAEQLRVALEIIERLTRPAERVTGTGWPA